MIITKNIYFKNFSKKYSSSINNKLKFLLKENNEILNSLKSSYKYSYSSKFINRYKKNFSILRIIGMGGSSLGAHAIYDFLKNKIKKNFLFIDNLQASKKNDKKTNFTNLVISKSGNTIETIVNTNILVKKKRINAWFNIF